MRLILIPLLLSPLLSAQFAEKAHPRLWMDEAREQQVRKVIQSDPLAARMHQRLLKEADIILEERTPEHIIHDGRRLLRESRLALEQITITAWAWRLTGEERYFKRALADLEAVCGMKDWNTSHFLDTAEMAVAVATGYDWLYDSLDEKQRRMCERAIIDKALKPARKRYDTDEWWTDGRNNWAQVCGGGIAVAAIAVQGADENLSEGLIRDGLALLKKCERFYAPDGVYPEGPGYWHYGTNYHALLLAACESLGHEVSIPEKLERSGTSMIHLHGPTRLPFNFSDGKARVSSKSFAQVWIASHFNNTQQAASVREVLSQHLELKDEDLKDRHFPLTLISLPTQPEKVDPLPLHSIMHGEQSVATFRTSWDADACWLAIKGGTPEGGHGHMDVGTFCYDAHGMRWIHDLGGDDYNMPGYFQEERFNYFRLQNRSHNTLEINEALQNAHSKPCPIVDSATGEKPFAKFKLTPAYTKQAEKVMRTAHFDPKTGSARIRDEIHKPLGKVVWRAFTDAECRIEGDEVVLSKKGKSIRFKRLSAAGEWKISDASPPLEIEDDNEDYTEVSLSLPVGDEVIIEVEIRP